MPRPPGRPRGSVRITSARASVATWLPAILHDQLIQLAKAQDKSVSATVRDILILRLR